MSRTAVLGLDGGGTKTDAVAATSTGETIGTGRSGPCNLAAVPVRECIQSVLAASQAALRAAGLSEADVRAVCIGAAGVSFQRRARAFGKALQIHFPNAAIEVVPDYITGHRGALAGEPGIIAIAGTGSVVYGIDAFCRAHKAGAYGFRIDDAGSGYGVGRSALAAVMRAADGSGEPTLLTERILANLKLEGIEAIVPAVYGNRIDRLTIGSLAETVANAAMQENDFVATQILAEAGAALARLTAAVLRSLFAEASQTVPIARIGSLWNCGPYLEESYTSILEMAGIPFLLTDPLNSPAEGAVRMALQPNTS